MIARWEAEEGHWLACNSLDGHSVWVAINRDACEVACVGGEREHGAKLGGRLRWAADVEAERARFLNTLAVHFISVFVFLC